jgi:hypothetical protein
LLIVIDRLPQVLVNFKPLILNIRSFEKGFNSSILDLNPYFIFVMMVLEFFIETECILVLSVSKDSFVVTFVLLNQGLDWRKLGKMRIVFGKVSFCGEPSQANFSYFGGTDEIFGGQSKFTVLDLEVSDVVVTNTRSSVVFSFKHIARFSKIYHSECILFFHKVVVGELLI